MKSIKTKSLWVVEIYTPAEWSDPIDSAWSSKEKAEARACALDHELLDQDDRSASYVTEYFFGLGQFMPWFVE